ncbi:hypothetical protein [Inquilinus limosus]|uniref:hypothetical protein n=1 Tax=Inquilinus limosus TaxID=171674 RepID=UPI001269A238|nr:hypothetical protein [Inquilinus limosus]
MTVVYEPVGVDGYQLCQPIDPSGFALINKAIGGNGSLKGWKPPTMRFVNVDKRKKLKESDSPWLSSSALIFRKEACERLEEIPNLDAEFLRFDCDGIDLFFLKPPIVGNILDTERSDISWFDDGRIMAIWRPVFRNDLIRDIVAFKISDLDVSPTFVTQAFLESWSKGGLRGLDFRKV